ncbi:MAG: stage II sporulation protein M [Chloroflexi bacterium]|nr:stage II sporulation protein M [Chloroflexota bacterium]
MKYRDWLFIAIALFVISIIVGWSIPNDISGLLGEDIAQLAQLSNFLLSLPPIVTALLIFLKNSLSLLISFALSPLLCLIPILALAFNGALLGSISAAIIERESVGLLLAGILPHGVIELPAFIIGEAAALSFGSLAIVSLFKKDARDSLWPHLKQNLKYLTIALALLLPAAFIEAFITPLLLK